jgi:hypothetical protein
MPISLEEQLMSLVAVKLATITIANGYEQTVLGVHRPPVGVFDIAPASCPALVVRKEASIPRFHLREAEEILLAVEVLCVATTPALLVSLMADVKKLANANKYWNDGAANLARRTRNTDERQHETETDEETVTGRIVFEIMARSKLADPYTTRTI